MVGIFKSLFKPESLEAPSKPPSFKNMPATAPDSKANGAGISGPEIKTHRLDAAELPQALRSTSVASPHPEATTQTPSKITLTPEQQKKYDNLSDPDRQQMLKLLEGAEQAKQKVAESAQAYFELLNASEALKSVDEAANQTIQELNQLLEQQSATAAEPNESQASQE